MIKYTDTEVVFREIPDEVTLAINISNCPFRCKGCHSPELWEDIGTELTFDELDKLIKTNSGISCVCFMGGDSDPDTIVVLAEFIKAKYPDLKVGWYSGQKTFPHPDLEAFDYIKVGRYLASLGGLDTPGTNQILYKKEIISRGIYEWKDITKKFWEDA